MWWPQSHDQRLGSGVSWIRVRLLHIEQRKNKSRVETNRTKGKWGVSRAKLRRRKVLGRGLFKERDDDHAHLRREWPNLHVLSVMMILRRDYHGKEAHQKIRHECY